MSSDFWLNLLLALLIFVSALTYINRSKIRFIREILAQRLRRRVLPRLQSILPMIVSAFNSKQPASEKFTFFPLFRLRADLEALCLKSDVLFEIERMALSDFLVKLSPVVGKLEEGLAETEDIDELLLSGQRAINEISELA